MLYLSGIILSFFLSFVLFTKRERSDADTILAAWLCLIGIHTALYYMFFTGNHINYPALAGPGFSLPLCHGPFLFLYTFQQTSIRQFRKEYLLHFLPVLLSAFLFMDYFSLPYEQKVEVLLNKGKGYETVMQINRYAIFASGFIYVILSMIRLVNYRKNLVHRFSNTEKINFTWLLFLIIWILIIWSIVLFIGDDKWVFASVSFYVIWLGYFGIKQVNVFSNGSEHSEKINSFNHGTIGSGDYATVSGQVKTVDLDENPGSVKYLKSSLSELEADRIHVRLKEIMAVEKPFTDPEINLNSLSAMINVHPNHLSQVINSREHKSFYEVINDLRSQEFIKRLSDPSNQNFTLLAIAGDCGFNSKASFNRNFKKYSGMTPSEYQKQLSRK